MEKYIAIYNIEKDLIDYIIGFKDFNELSKIYNNSTALLFIIKTCKLQDKYNFTNFKLIPEKNQNFYNFIKNMYCTYNISTKMLSELNEYIKKNIEKNYLDLFSVMEIFRNNENNPEFNENIQQFVFDYLLNFDKNEADDEYLKKYYSFLIKNKIEKFEKDANFLSIENIELLINRDYFKTAFYLVKNIEKSEQRKISDDLLEKIINSFSVDKKDEIKDFLEIFPNKVKSIIRNFKEKKKLKELLGVLKYAKKL